MENNVSSTQIIREIDILDFFKILWGGKFLILGTGLLFTAIAIAYALLTPPVYEARAYFLPPMPVDVALLDEGIKADAALVSYTPKEAYDVFLRHLQSDDLRRAIFSHVYLPYFPSSDQSRSQDVMYARYESGISIGVDNKAQPNRYVLKVQNSDSALAAKLVEAFMLEAGTLAVKEIVSDVQRQLKAAAVGVERQIDLLKEIERRKRDDAIARLQESLEIAQAIEQEKPVVMPFYGGEGRSGVAQGRLAYMQGSQALRAQINVLQRRKTDDPFIAQLRPLQIKLQSIESFKTDPEALAVFRPDGSTGVPDAPIRPRKLLAIEMGVLGGFGLGGLLALVRHSVLIRRNRATIA